MKSTIGLLFVTLLLPLSSMARPNGFSPDIEDRLSQLKQEPSVVEAQTAALRFFNIDPGAVASMRQRAALKGLMPRLDARYRVNQSDMDADTMNLNVNQDAPFLFDSAQGKVQELQLGLSWNLPSLIFNAEVLDVGSLAVLQEGVLKEVTRLYYTRRRLQIDLILNPPNDPRSELTKQLRIEELTSTLNAMTGNIFLEYEKRRMSRRDSERYEPQKISPMQSESLRFSNQDEDERRGQPLVFPVEDGSRR